MNVSNTNKKHLFDASIINFETVSHSTKTGSTLRTNLLGNLKNSQFHMQINRIVDQHDKAIDFKTLSYHENSEVKQARENGEKKIKTSFKNSDKIGISFIEAPKPSGFNYVDVTQSIDVWEKNKNCKVTSTILAGVIGF